MATTTTEDVRVLFNRKAGAMELKYLPNGKLTSRLNRFMERLGEVSPPPGRVLDLGCGTGDLAAALSRQGYQVTACDIAEKMIEMARAVHMGAAVEWASLKPDWKALPFGEGSFRSVAASSVFEYLVDVEPVVAEISRVLQPGGVLLLTVPNPCNLLRKVEGRLRPKVSKRGLTRLMRRVLRIDSYARYLQLSRNRFTGERWQSVLSSAYLAPIDPRDFSSEAWQAQARFPLLLLAVRKAGARVLGRSAGFQPALCRQDGGTTIKKTTTHQ